MCDLSDVRVICRIDMRGLVRIVGICALAQAGEEMNSQPALIHYRTNELHRHIIK